MTWRRWLIVGGLVAVLAYGGWTYYSWPAGGNNPVLREADRVTDEVAQKDEAIRNLSKEIQVRTEAAAKAHQDAVAARATSELYRKESEAARAREAKLLADREALKPVTTTKEALDALRAFGF